MRLIFLNPTQGEVDHFGAAPTPNDMQGSVGLGDIAYFFRRRWTLIACVTGMCLAIAAMFIVMAVPEYTASAQILFNPPRDKAIGAEGSLSDAPLDPLAVDSQISLIKSRTLLQRVVDQQRLTQDSEFSNGPSEGLVGRIRSLLVRPSAEPNSDLLQMRTVEALQERLNVERVAKTYVVSISVTSSDREKAMRLASAVANTYIADRLASRAAASERSIRLINPPTTPTSPSYPKQMLTFALALLAGLILGTGVAIAIEVTTVGFATPAQIEGLLGVPVLAMLGKLTSKSSVKRKKEFEGSAASHSDAGSVLTDAVDEPMTTLLAEPMAGFSETFRTLIYNIQMTSRGNPPKVILVTSSAPGEGKTTVARCLATSAAASDLRAVFVDFDLRGASATESHQSKRSVGLIDVFKGTATLADALRFDPKTGIYVLPVGSQANGPIELFKTSQLKNVLEYLCAEFDYIVIDSPPLGPVTDAAILASLADKIVLVVKWNETPQEIVQTAVRQLFENYDRVGVVLNFIDQRQAPKYDRHAYAQFRSNSRQSRKAANLVIPPFERSFVNLLTTAGPLPSAVNAETRPDDSANVCPSNDTFETGRMGEADNDRSVAANGCARALPREEAVPRLAVTGLN